MPSGRPRPSPGIASSYSSSSPRIRLWGRIRSRDRLLSHDQRGPKVLHHAGPVTALGGRVDVARVVGVVADPIDEGILVDHSLYSNPRLALGKKPNVRPGERHPPKVRLGGRVFRTSGDHAFAPTRTPQTFSERVSTAVRCFRYPEALLDQIQLPGACYRLRAAVRVELAVEVVDVGLDRAHADEQLGGDPAVTLAGGYKLQNFELAPAQGFGKPLCWQPGTRIVLLQCRQELPDVVRRHAG